ncbi:MAG: hypothetical protein V3T78_00375, partial [Dehalococcoidia bacterium]
MIRRVRHRQRGNATIMVLAFMALAIPLVTSSLGLASTLSIDSRVKTGITLSQYAAIAGGQHGTYRVLYESGYLESLQPDVPDEYTVNINGRDVTVTVVKLDDDLSLPSVPPGPNSRVFRASKVVSPTTVLADTLTTYTYTATITNGTETEQKITQIWDVFPQGMSYVSGSSMGLTTNDPEVAGDRLKWNLTVAEGTLPPMSSKDIEFKMTGTLPEGVYCNDVWVSPHGDKTRSGLTAKIIVGSPSSTLCPGTAIQLNKSVDKTTALPGEILTYTLTFTSDGTDPVDIDKIEDILPTGFNYVSGSTEGLTTVDPIIKYLPQQELKWTGSPIGTVAPGGSATLTFKVMTSSDVG